MQVHPQQQVGLFLLAAVGPNMGTFISSGMGEVTQSSNLVRGQLGDQMLC